MKVYQPKDWWESKKKSSPTGNRTRVFRVTGGDTYHYTIEDFCMILYWLGFCAKRYKVPPYLQTYRKRWFVISGGRRDSDTLGTDSGYTLTFYKDEKSTHIKGKILLDTCTQAQKVWLL